LVVLVLVLVLASLKLSFILAVFGIGISRLRGPATASMVCSVSEQNPIRMGQKVVGHGLPSLPSGPDLAYE
jgi:hypothetical protein